MQAVRGGTVAFVVPAHCSCQYTRMPSPKLPTPYADTAEKTMHKRTMTVKPVTATTPTSMLKLVTAGGGCLDGCDVGWPDGIPGGRKIGRLVGLACFFTGFHRMNQKRTHHQNSSLLVHPSYIPTTAHGPW